MNTNVRIDTVMQFSTPAEQLIDLHIIGMTFDFDSGDILALQLSVLCDYPDYERIEAEGLFNLDLGELEVNARNDFDPKIAINLDIKIDPDLLFLLSANASTEEEIVTYFVEQNHENVNNPLYLTHNWFALHVTQEQPVPENLEGTLKVGYKTKWA